MIQLFSWRPQRRPEPPPAPRRGPAIQRAEQDAARARLLAQARRRQAEHRYDGPAR